MAVTFKNITDQAKAVVKADTALATWCDSKFGRAPKVYIGMDAANPPQESDCPFIAFVVASRKGGMEAGETIFELIVTFGLVCSTMTKDTGEAGDETLEGVNLIGEFWELIWAALAADFSPNVFLSEEDTDIDGVVTFPLFLGASQITIRIPTILGADLSL